MTGLNPAEHGLTRAHAHLSLRAETLTEMFFDRGYWTCAFVERSSLLSCTGVLQGFQRVIQNTGADLVESATGYVGKHLGDRPLLALLEVDAASCGGVAGVCTQIGRIVDDLEGDRFFRDGGALVVCAPGGAALETEAAFKKAALREFLLVRCDELDTVPESPITAPMSLSDLFGVVTSVAWAGTIGEGELIQNSRCVVTEMTLPLSEPPRNGDPPIFPQFCRMVRFNDLAHRCFVSAAKEFEFQDDRFRPAAVDSADESLARERIEFYLRDLNGIEDVNVSRTAGLKITSTLVAKLGEEWSNDEFRLRPLHSVEHYRMGRALEEAGFGVLAINEYRTALAIDREFSRALFSIANAYAALDPSSAVPYFQAYIRRFGDRKEEESFLRRARKFLEAESTKLSSD